MENYKALIENLRNNKVEIKGLKGEFIQGKCKKYHKLGRVEIKCRIYQYLHKITKNPKYNFYF